MDNLSTGEWAMLGLGGLLLAWIVWVLLRNSLLGPPKISRSGEDKPK